MVYGNSDFPELPYEVERAWDESDVEMKPVNEVLITDDFKYKVKGSNEECPHFAGWHFKETLQQPSTFSENDKQAHYNLLMNYDSTTRDSTTTTTSQFPQHIFTFDLIAMVERKMGAEIPSIDKVSWLKEKLTHVVMYIYGYGSCPTGPIFRATNYFADTSAWNGANWNHTYSTTTALKCSIGSSNISRVIDSNGKVCFVAYTDATNGTTASEIHVDYVSIEIKLNLESNYTTLYCSNTRAREDKCNPILVQEQTKTVKRFLPSKECFTTEFKYVDMKRMKMDTDSVLLTKLYENGKVYSTTQGSGSYLTTNSARYKNITNILKLDSIYPYTFFNDNLYTSPLLGLITFSNQLTDTNINNGSNTKFMPSECYDIPRYLLFKPYLSIHDNEMRLYIYSSLITKNSTTTSYYSHSATLQSLYVYDISNRPLIK